MNYFQSKAIKIGTKLVFIIIILSIILPSYQILFAESAKNPQPQNARMMYVPTQEMSISDSPSGKLHQPYDGTNPTLNNDQRNLSNAASTQNAANALKASTVAINHPEPIEPTASSANSDLIDANVLLAGMAPILALVSFMAYKTLGRPIKSKIPVNIDWFLHGEPTQVAKNTK